MQQSGPPRPPWKTLGRCNLLRDRDCRGRAEADLLGHTRPTSRHARRMDSIADRCTVVVRCHNAMNAGVGIPISSRLLCKTQYNRAFVVAVRVVQMYQWRGKGRDALRPLESSFRWGRAKKFWSFNIIAPSRATEHNKNPNCLHAAHVFLPCLAGCMSPCQIGTNSHKRH